MIGRQHFVAGPKLRGAQNGVNARGGIRHKGDVHEPCAKERGQRRPRSVEPVLELIVEKRQRSLFQLLAQLALALENRPRARAKAAVVQERHVWGEQPVAGHVPVSSSNSLMARVPVADSSLCGFRVWIVTPTPRYILGHRDGRNRTARHDSNLRMLPRIWRVGKVSDRSAAVMLLFNMPVLLLAVLAVQRVPFWLFVLAGVILLIVPVLYFRFALIVMAEARSKVPTTATWWQALLDRWRA